MSRTLLALAIAGLGSLFGAGLYGQAPPPLLPGQTIRITDETGHRHTGELHAMWNDSLTLKDGNRFQTYTFADLSTIERKTEPPAIAGIILTTMGVTALVGAVGGALGGAGGGASCDDEFFCLGPAGGIVVGALAGAVVGLPLGLVLTPIARSDRWEPVAMPSSHRRLGLGFTVTVPLPAW